MHKVISFGWAERTRVLIGGFGLIVGGVALYFALHNVSFDELIELVGRIKWPWLLAAGSLYGVITLMRAARWYLLLRQLNGVRFINVIEGTLAGFAANYLLPARLGELVRADYMKRAAALGRTAVIGSIGIERTIDGLMVLSILGAGAAELARSNWLDADAGNLVKSLLIVASLVFGGIAMVLVVIRRFEGRLSSSEHPLLQRLHMFTRGIRTLNRATILPALTLSLLIWFLEGLMLHLVLLAFGIVLTIPQLMVLCTSAALSTLAPTAPGFLGSLQLVFSELLVSFGEPPGIGVAAATAVQLICLLPYALIGVVVAMARWTTIAHGDLRRRGDNPAD